ncbi:linear gramicidin synthetase subunit D domain protein [Mycobacterium xenopi 4042]|uniref:Linear gramicidin synthetase subunit D domain protein n=1 Tax=Mycobacterium xenopi 4042 TaxID=1299334 RepID=X8AGQ3_MYCXE|nr:linear gramicidin synthetase subunit D domain protein [Mycobacterium xenopi 4042]
MGWFTIKYPVALTFAALGWAQVAAGEPILGAVIKDAKEQLRALPDGLTYGLLRYLNPDVELNGFEPVIGFNYFGRMGAPPRRSRPSCGGRARTLCSPRAATLVFRCRWRTPWTSMRSPSTPAPAAVARRLDVAPSAMDRAQVSRLSRLWFEALRGICAHVRRGGGGLTRRTSPLPGSPSSRSTSCVSSTGSPTCCR